MNFRNSENNLSRYTNGLVFTKAGEYGEFFYLSELVCNLWQVMLSGLSLKQGTRNRGMGMGNGERGIFKMGNL